jgi:hypothetical protein
MILLTATTDSIEVITGTATTVDVHASFIDMTTADPPVVKGSTSNRQHSAITTATTTTVVSAPAASTVRNVKTLHIRNKSSSVATDITIQFDQNGTNFELHKTTLAAGEACEYIEGVGFFDIKPVAIDPGVPIVAVINATQTGTNGTGVQNWFPTGPDLRPAANTTYRMTGLLATNRSAGATSHTTSLLFAGTATVTSIQYLASSKGDTDAIAAGSGTISRVATATVVKAASTSTTESMSINIDGIVRINAGGTFIPQFQYSAAPGGAPTIQANSYFRMEPLGSGSYVGG